MKEILKRLFNHEELTREEACSLMKNITGEKYNNTQIASLLTVFQMRGITVEELIGFREALLSTRVNVDLSEYRPIDIVGTGGDGKNTFNISTCACFVVAGAGYKVAKHGNYGSTSVSGASNVMEEHGVKFTNDNSRLRKSMEECGMVYMHAPLFNPAMVRNIFNLLGPLINPCIPAYQLLGVADLTLMRLYTNTLQRLGIGFAVVNNLDGYDEISLTDEFKVMTNRYETICKPSDIGFTIARREELYGGNTTREAAKIFDNVLDNRATKAQTECVLINAGQPRHKGTDRMRTDKRIVRHPGHRASTPDRGMCGEGTRVARKRTRHADTEEIHPDKPIINSTSMKEDILTQITANKRKEISRQMEAVSMKRLEAIIAMRETREPLSLSRSVMSSPTGIISEFKRRSPSKGWINREADVRLITGGYAEAGAAGLSVLTDTDFFGGSEGDGISDIAVRSHSG